MCLFVPQEIQQTQNIYDLKAIEDHEKQLLARCARLMLQGKLPLKPPPIDAIAVSHFAVDFKTHVPLQEWC